MSYAIVIIIIILITIIPIFIGSILLEIVLSKKKNKFLGLILPIISLLMASIIIFGNYSMENVKRTSLITKGEVISEVVEYQNVDNRINFSIIVITIFFNIPTFIYLGIYLSYSKYRKELTSIKQDELMKMNIQDLE